MKEIFCIVSGRVQGVFYRDFVFNTARALGINGAVRNLPDGTVEVVAEGDESKLNDFLTSIKKGPPLSKVDNVKVQWSESTKKFSSFEILDKDF
ncbi:MAG: acylphosphatase [bacterium]|nr:acylphosphatase [bacterium]